jgi:hypothetical protein
MRLSFKKSAFLFALFILTGSLAFAQELNLNFTNWYTWPSGGVLRAAVNRNTVTFNGTVTTAGYVTERVNTSYRNRVVTFTVDVGNSVFDNQRMFKLTVNRNDRLLRPNNVTDLIEKEYVPAYENVVEITLPNDFDGKLGFVFYRAQLRDLKITATYR